MDEHRQGVATNGARAESTSEQGWGKDRGPQDLDPTIPREMDDQARRTRIATERRPRRRPQGRGGWGVSNNERPRRRYTLQIEIGADTWDAVIGDLHYLAGHIEQHGPACSGVMGGSDVGHTVTAIEDPQQTHERYFEQLDAWIAAWDAAKGKGGGA